MKSLSIPTERAGRMLVRPWGLFFTALLVRLFCIIFVVGLSSPPMYDARRYHALAASLAAGTGFRVAGELPTSFYPPLYPTVLACIYKLTGSHPSAAYLFQAVIGALIVVLIFCLGRELFSRREGLAAGLIASIYPMFIYFSSLISTENLFVLILMGFTLVLIRVQRSGPRRTAVVAGLLVGAAALTRAFFLAFLPLILLWGLLAFPRERALGLRRSALVLLCALLAIAPWTLRNYLVHRAFVPVSTGGGSAFWGGNNAALLDDSSSSRYGGWVPFGERPDRERLLQFEEGESTEFLLEPDQDRRSYLLGLSFLREHRGEIPRLVFRKLMRFWGVRTRFTSRNMLVTVANALSYGVLLPFFLFGLITTLRSRDRRRELAPIYLLLLWSQVLAVVFYGSLRFRISIEPFIILFGVHGLSEILKKAGIRRE